MQEHREGPEGEEAQLMATDSLTAWRPFTGSSEAQMPLLVLEKGRTSLKRMKADIARGVVEGDWALFLVTHLLWGFQDCATSCLATISALCCNSLSYTVLLRARPQLPALLLSRVLWLVLSPAPAAAPWLLLDMMGSRGSSCVSMKNPQPDCCCDCMWRKLRVHLLFGAVVGSSNHAKLFIHV